MTTLRHQFGAVAYLLSDGRQKQGMPCGSSKHAPKFTHFGMSGVRGSRARHRGSENLVMSSQPDRGQGGA